MKLLTHKLTHLLITLSILSLGVINAHAQEGKDFQLTTDSEEAKVLMDKSYKAMMDMRFDESDKYLQEALEKDPDFPFANAIYAMNVLGKGETKKAQQHMEKATANLDQLTEYERLYIQSMSHMMNGSNDMTPMLSMVEKYPDDFSARMVLMYAYSIGPNKDLDKAFEQADKLLEINNNFSPAYNIMGYLHMEKKEMDQAKAAFEKALKLSPDQANPYDSMGDYYMAVGEYEKAAKHFKKAYEMDPEGMAISKEKMEKAQKAQEN